MRKPRVLFYYPQHFNRTAEGTNPFFDKLLEACDKMDILYRLYEEPDRGTDKPRNPKAQKADFFFWLVWIVRKFVKRFSSNDFYHREKYVARIINILTFGYYKSDVYVTISESMLHLFSYLNPKGKVYDLQHGVQYKEFRSFYDEEKYLKCHYDRENIYFLDYGAGYRKALISGAEERMGHRVFVIGCPLDVPQKDVLYDGRSNRILIALQMTDSCSYDELQFQKEQLDDFLNEIKTLNYEVLLRHHPRYNNCIDISDILHKYSFVKLTNDRLADVAEKVLLHVTIVSTTAFDIAAYGVPSYFTGTFMNGNSMSFYDDYTYPLYKDMNIVSVLYRLLDPKLWKEDSKIVQEWYSKFYEPFNETTFKNLILE